MTKNEIMERIEELEARGFRRWTKNGMDRLYISATDLGLECRYYKTGNISYAAWNGEEISHSEGGRMKNAKTYIDLTDGTLHGTREDLIEAAERLLESLEEEEEEINEEAEDTIEDRRCLQDRS